MTLEQALFNAERARFRADEMLVPCWEILYRRSTQSGGADAECIKNFEIKCVDNLGQAFQPLASFSDLKAPQPITEALERMQITELTGIQQKCIPAILAGRDVIGVSSTGSGKTLAFELPLLLRILRENWKTINKTPSTYDSELDVLCRPVTIILAPERDLALQLTAEAWKLSYKTGILVRPFVGGDSERKQLLYLRHGTDILVSTPQRLTQLLAEQSVDLQCVKALVLDEIDQLALSSLPALQNIKQALPNAVQTLSFSATMTKETLHSVSGLFTTPFIVSAVQKQQTQYAYIQIEVDKIDALKHIADRPGQFIVFCSSEQQAERVNQSLSAWLKLQNPPAIKPSVKERLLALERKGVLRYFSMKVQEPRESELLTAAMPQTQRTTLLQKFKQKTLKVLVTTDLIQRGVDLSADYLVNFSAPSQLNEFTHRVGRIGRAGRHGMAITFFGKDDAELVRELAKRFPGEINLL